jgi:catechol 2,3-dioxygenase-like lactoylglutathione lyase family enzyme
MAKTSTDLQQLTTVMVPVRDQDRAIDYYVDTLGFEKRADIRFGEDDGERWVEVGPPGAPTSVALTPERGDWVVGRMTGVCFAAGDIDATHARLGDAGVDADPEVMRPDGPPPPMFWFRDLDGNQFLIVETR